MSVHDFALARGFKAADVLQDHATNVLGKPISEAFYFFWARSIAYRIRHNNVPDDVMIRIARTSGLLNER